MIGSDWPAPGLGLQSPWTCGLSSEYMLHDWAVSIVDSCAKVKSIPRCLLSNPEGEKISKHHSWGWVLQWSSKSVDILSQVIMDSLTDLNSEEPLWEQVGFAANKSEASQSSKDDMWDTAVDTETKICGSWEWSIWCESEMMQLI